jgi:hypothetical protein
MSKTIKNRKEWPTLLVILVVVVTTVVVVTIIGQCLNEETEYQQRSRESINKFMAGEEVLVEDLPFLEGVLVYVNLSGMRSREEITEEEHKALVRAYKNRTIKRE